MPEVVFSDGSNLIILFHLFKIDLVLRFDMVLRTTVLLPNGRIEKYVMIGLRLGPLPKVSSTLVTNMLFLKF